MSSRPVRLAVLAVLFACAATSPARAEDPRTPTPAGATGAPPRTFVVERGPFSVDLEREGTFDAPDAVEVGCRLEVFAGEVDVLEAAAAGPVEMGATLVRFSTEDLDRQVEAARIDLELSARALAKAQEESARAQESAAVTLDRAAADARRAAQALESFLGTEKDLRLHEVELRLQATRDNVSDQVEELAQLEKMYKADDVTEETEDIVLKRSRRQLERARTSLGYQTERARLLKDVELPRDEENLRLTQRRAAVDHDRAKATTPIAVETARWELEKAKVAHARKKESFDDLAADRDRLTVQAPVAGWAAPGSFARGRWTGTEDLARAMRPGRRMKPAPVLWTIVPGTASSVRTTVPEGSLFLVRPGQIARVFPTATPDARLDARVVRVARVASEGGFEVLLELSTFDDRLLAGQTCKVQVRTLEKAETITVPAAALSSEGSRRFVHVWTGERAEPRTVRVGPTSDGRTEVVDGLVPGERVLEKAPAAETK